MHATYFETLTAMACVLFRERRVETGRAGGRDGGRLDATNVVEPAVSVITPVDFDHEKFLATPSRRLPGKKRASSSRAGRWYCPRSGRKRTRCCAGRAAELGAPLTDARSGGAESATALRASRFRLAGATVCDVELGLVGRTRWRTRARQRRRCRYWAWRQPTSAGTQQARWPGRLEFVRAVGNCCWMARTTRRGRRAGGLPGPVPARAPNPDGVRAMHDKDLHQLAIRCFRSPRSWSSRRPTIRAVGRPRRRAR